jgi:hypothetical protein
MIRLVGALSLPDEVGLARRRRQAGVEERRGSAGRVAAQRCQGDLPEGDVPESCYPMRRRLSRLARPGALNEFRPDGSVRAWRDQRPHMRDGAA